MGMPVEVCFMIKRIHQMRERMREREQGEKGRDGGRQRTEKHPSGRCKRPRLCGSIRIQKHSLNMRGWPLRK